jgi:hypothetical protein
METLIEIIDETPFWVYLIFAFLLFSGIRASHPRTMTLSRLFFLPTLLVLWSIYGLYERWHGHWTDVYYWIVSLVCGSYIGWWMIHQWKIRVDRERKALILPGTWSTLWLVLIIFAVRYFFGYYYATHSTIPHSVLLTDVIVSGIITGVFVGRSMNYLYRYEKAV